MLRPTANLLVCDKTLWDITFYDIQFYSTFIFLKKINIFLCFISFELYFNQYEENNLNFYIFHSYYLYNVSPIAQKRQDRD